jgi:DNA-binding transcriptional MerR regulator
MATVELLTISDAARAVGVSAHTLRYYERAGLMLDPIERTAATHRRYTDEDLRWIQMVTRLRATGMPIRDVRRYATLVRDGDGNEAERLDLLLAHRQVVEQQLAEVTSHLRAIDHKIALYEHKVAPAS